MSHNPGYTGGSRTNPASTQPSSQREDTILSSTSTRRAYVSVALFAAVFAAFCFLLAGALAVNGEAAQRGKQIKVMTRNVYLGADLTDAVNAASTGEFVE